MSSPDNAELDYYYPTQTLVTAPEIIFFWVARMIMAGEEFKGKFHLKRFISPASCATSRAGR